MKYAPIVVFCYKRIDTLKECIESLKKCKESVDSHLLIISDAPAKDADKEKVEVVRTYLQTISGFKSFEIIERPENLGVDFNIINGLNELSKRFERFIIIEDDIVVAPDFLNYINLALDYYEHYPRVLSISGFSYIRRIPKSYLFDVYFAARTNPWGWATWAAKIKNVNWHLDVGWKEEFFNSKTIQDEFNEWGSDRSRMLRNTLENKIRAWDIRLDYDQFKNGTYTLYPTKTLTENIGFGREDSSNTFGYNRFKTDLNASKKSSFKFPDLIFFDKTLTSRFINKNSLLQRIFTRVMKIIGYKN